MIGPGVSGMVFGPWRSAMAFWCRGSPLPPGRSIYFRAHDHPGSGQVAKRPVPTDSLFLNAPIHRTVEAGEDHVHPRVRYGRAHVRDRTRGRWDLLPQEPGVGGHPCGPNDVFGERALIDHLPRNLTAVATVETVLAESTGACSCSWSTSRRPSPWASWGRSPARRFRDYDELIAGLAGGTAGTGVTPIRPDHIDPPAVRWNGRPAWPPLPWGRWRGR